MSGAAKIKAISANGMREVIADTKARFEATTGYRLAVTVVETGEIRRRVLAGEIYDVVIVPANVMDAFVAAGKIKPEPTPTVVINFGLAVRADVEKPDVSTPAALKKTLLAAKTVLITDPSTGGISGVHLMEVLEQLGIAEAMKPKLKPNPGRALHATRVVSGEADLAVQAEHEIRSVPGAAFLDYPKEFRRPIVFMAGLGTTTRDAAAARRYIAFLKGPDAIAAMTAHHLSPA